MATVDHAENLRQSVTSGTAKPAASVRKSPAISVHRLGKIFADGTEALRDVSLTVEQDEFVSIVGASGCGKSTLLRIIAGLDSPTFGEVSVHGSTVTAPRQEIGLMFQRPALLQWKTALENVLVPVKLRRRGARQDIEEAVRLLRLFGLGGFEARFPAQLSGGMQQRVALARLLMTGASARLLDEPFGALDELTREHLNGQLGKVHDETRSATLLITHNVYEAVLLSDRVLVMTPRPGAIAAEIPVSLSRPRSLDLMRTSDYQEIVTMVRDHLADARGGSDE